MLAEVRDNLVSRIASLQPRGLVPRFVASYVAAIVVVLEQHQGEGGHDPAEHDPAQHGGVSHEEMMRHCAEMRGQQTGEEPPASHPH